MFPAFWLESKCIFLFFSSTVLSNYSAGHQCHISAFEQFGGLEDFKTSMTEVAGTVQFLSFPCEEANKY